MIHFCVNNFTSNVWSNALLFDTNKCAHLLFLPIKVGFSHATMSGFKI